MSSRPAASAASTMFAALLLTAVMTALLLLTSLHKHEVVCEDCTTVPQSPAGRLDASPRPSATAPCTGRIAPA